MKTRTLGLVVLCCLVALVAPACGSRRSKQEILADNSAQVAGRTRNGVATGDSSDASTEGDLSAGDAGATGQAVGTAGGAGASNARSASAGGATGSGGGAAGVAGKGAPIVVGVIATTSGFAGSLGADVRDGWVAWSKSVNAKGGINDHPVTLLVADDGGNQAQAVSIARDFVENKGAVALSISSSEVAGVADYAKTKNVPVVGAFGGTTEWYTKPMMFLPYSYTDGAGWGPARVAKDNGVTKAATVYCVESAVCKQNNDTFVKYAQEIGLPVVAQVQISLTQPDYTAECLRLRNAGADGIYFVGEANSATRIAQSCGRQTYKPKWVMPIVTVPMAQVPELQGSLSFDTAFPWMLPASTSPALAEYNDAMKKYAPNRLADDAGTGQTLAWVSAKALEKAAASVGARPSGQDVLNGLWAMRGDTLNGLMPGRAAVTFNKGAPGPSVDPFCVWPMKVVNNTWTAPDGVNPICR